MNYFVLTYGEPNEVLISFSKDDLFAGNFEQASKESEDCKRDFCNAFPCYELERVTYFQYEVCKTNGHDTDLEELRKELLEVGWKEGAWEFVEDINE